MGGWWKKLWAIYLTCSFRNVSDNFAWAFAGVYGPNIDHERMLLWDELARLLNW